MVALLKRLAAKAHKDAGWPGILVGDMSQPRGGPMLTGHASHQVGLDADIWLTPMPDRLLSREEREEMSAIMMVRDDRLDIDPKVWTPSHLAVIRDAAQEPSVQRIFVNAAIKKALCREAKGDRSWLSKVRPMYGHDYHFHIRMQMPARQQRMREPARAGRRRRLQRRRSRLLVQGFGAASEAAEGAAEAEAADDAGAIAGRLQGGAVRAGREASNDRANGLSSPPDALRSESRAVSARPNRDDGPASHFIERRSAWHAARGQHRETTMRISARNQIKGTVVEVKKGATTSHVRVDIGGGQIVTSSITNEAVDDLGIKAKGTSPS